MKSPLDRTKVVLRHLPPTISQSNLVEQVDSRFSGRYRWLEFRPGKSSLKHLTYSRAYIDFNKPEDVIEFAEYFNDHVFVNEKGTQFKAIVEYAPSQRLPKQCSKKDGREGTILKDPEYLEFLEFLAKPVENLPSAEIQLERKQAERAGAPKDDPIVTPLMDFVRQKRAAKVGARRTGLNGKPTRSPVSSSSKRGSEKRRASTTMYVLRDSSKVTSSKNKSTYLLLQKQDQQLVDKSVNSGDVLGNEALEGKKGAPGSTGIGKKKILLLKGKEKVSNVSVGSSLPLNEGNPAKTYNSPAPPKQNQIHEAGGRIIRNILLKRDTRQPSSVSLTSKVVDSTEGTNVETRNEMPSTRGGHYSSENGSYKHGGRRGSVYNYKDLDGSSVVEGKASKRGASSKYGPNEKHVWVQKSGPGT